MNQTLMSLITFCDEYLFERLDFSSSVGEGSGVVVIFIITWKKNALLMKTEIGDEKVPKRHENEFGH